ncbi:hypothetical protein EVAR_46872_1 [Eumeta japonica]|uniref:Uncharacterized protein n=1 Tax=Eumeta variegata TaxID=151549 RepID=A0A4C1XNL8_EUMVA|nr:hypothetical protein EVAR_46872_1 [Eumeta japonica]
MRGEKSGVQRRVIEIYPLAYFLPCWSHSWNLILGDAASSCVQGKSFFGLLQRWECRVSSVKAVKYQLSDICDALKDLAENTTDCQLSSLVAAREIAEENDIDRHFKEVRRRRKKRHFDYEGEDETHELNAEEIFKINYFYVIVDNVRASCRPRLEALKHHESIFGFMYNIKRLKEISDSELLKQCSDLQISMTVGESCDIDGYLLSHHIGTFPWDKGPRKDLPPGASQWLPFGTPKDIETGRKERGYSSNLIQNEPLARRTVGSSAMSVQRASTFSQKFSIPPYIPTIYDPHFTTFTHYSETNHSIFREPPPRFSRVPTERECSRLVRRLDEWDDDEMRFSILREPSSSRVADDRQIRLLR